jgi:hypothetical protein
MSETSKKPLISPLGPVDWAKEARKLAFSAQKPPTTEGWLANGAGGFFDLLAANGLVIAFTLGLAWMPATAGQGVAAHVAEAFALAAATKGAFNVAEAAVRRSPRAGLAMARAQARCWGASAMIIVRDVPLRLCQLNSALARRFAAAGAPGAGAWGAAAKRWEESHWWSEKTISRDRAERHRAIDEMTIARGDKAVWRRLRVHVNNMDALSATELFLAAPINPDWPMPSPKLLDKLVKRSPSVENNVVNVIAMIGVGLTQIGRYNQEQAERIAEVPRRASALRETAELIRALDTASQAPRSSAKDTPLPAGASRLNEKKGAKTNSASWREKAKGAPARDAGGRVNGGQPGSGASRGVAGTAGAASAASANEQTRSVATADHAHGSEAAGERGSVSAKPRRL